MVVRLAWNEKCLDCRHLCGGERGAEVCDR